MRIRECAPLCLAQDSGWGGVSRGWARIGAANTLLRGANGVKPIIHPAAPACVRPSPPPDPGDEAECQTGD